MAEFDFFEQSMEVRWVCSKCLETSWAGTWKEVECWCEDCGDHYGRECPGCKFWFDSVWNSDELEKAQK
jgi:hypothetical protein